MTKKKNNPQGETKKVTTTTTTVVEETIVEKKPGKTYYAFVVDRSGSMSSIRKQTIDNFNEQIQTLRELQNQYPDEKYFVTLCVFNWKVETVYEDVPLDEVRLLNEETYVPNGGTALHDAIGVTIKGLKKRNKKALKKKKNEALVVILTDGFENSSRKYSGADVRELIDTVEDRDNWTVSFIGSNKESINTATQTLGIRNAAYVNFADTNAYEKFYASGGFNQSLKSRAMAKSSGASVKSEFFAGAVNKSGELDGNYDQTKVEELIKKQTEEKKDKSDK